MKKFISVFLIVFLLAGGSFGYASGTPTAYKINPGDARWLTKLNAGLDALWNNITAFATTINDWAIEDQMVTMIPVTCTYSDNNTFTLAGDYTSRFTTGAVVQVQVAAGMVFSTVASSSYAAPTTTVNLNDTVLTNPLTRVYVVATRDGLWPNGPGYVVARDYGTDRAALVAADAIATAAGKELRITAAFPIDADVTLAAPKVTVQPGVPFAVSTTKTLTISGVPDAGLYQIFSCTGTGKVTFGSGAVKECYPEWWTPNTSPGTTDMTVAINAAFASGAPALYLTSSYWVGDVTIPAAIDVYGPGKLIGDGTDLVSAAGALATGVAYGSTIAIGTSSFTVANSFAAGDVLLLSNYPVAAADRRKELLVVATATGAGFTTTTGVLQTYGSTVDLQFQKVTFIDGIHFYSPNWENHNFSFSLCRDLVIKDGKAIKCAVESKTGFELKIDFTDFDSQSASKFLNLYEMNRNFRVTGTFTGGSGVSDNGMVKMGGGSHFEVDINVNGTTNGGGYLHGLMIDPWYDSNPSGYDNQVVCYFTARVNCHSVYGYAIQITANATPTDVWPHDFYIDGQWADEASINIDYASKGVLAGHGKGGDLSINHTSDIIVINDNYATHTIANNTNLQGIWQDFTPTVSGTTGSAPEPTMDATSKGRYIKRGRTVDFRAAYKWTDKGSRTGSLVLNTPVAMTGSGTGLQASSISVGSYTGITTRTNGITGAINWGTATIGLVSDGATPVPLEATGTIYVSGTYETAD